MKVVPWFVYIIENEKGHLYTGITTNLERRFKEHTSSPKGAKFFRTALPKSMVFSRKFPNRSMALKFEASIKRMSRGQKLELISQSKI